MKERREASNGKIRKPKKRNPDSRWVDARRRRCLFAVESWLVSKLKTFAYRQLCASTKAIKYPLTEALITLIDNVIGPIMLMCFFARFFFRWLLNNFYVDNDFIIIYICLALAWAILSLHVHAVAKLDEQFLESIFNLQTRTERVQSDKSFTENKSIEDWELKTKNSMCSEEERENFRCKSFTWMT